MRRVQELAVRHAPQGFVTVARSRRLVRVLVEVGEMPHFVTLMCESEEAARRVWAVLSDRVSPDVLWSLAAGEPANEVK
jgi:hypothetical protein